MRLFRLKWFKKAAIFLEVTLLSLQVYAAANLDLSAINKHPLNNMIYLMPLRQVFNPLPIEGENGRFTASAAQFIMNNASLTKSQNSIQFLHLAFYNGVYAASGCGGTLVGTVSILDNTYGMPFINGQVISLNAYSVYDLAYNSMFSSYLQQIQCLAVYMDGSANYTYGVSSTPFQQTCTGVGGMCTTTTAAQSGEWVYNPTLGYTQYMYVSDAPSSGNATIDSCEIISAGQLSTCTPASYEMDWPHNPQAMATYNGYVYITFSAGNRIAYCQITATGSFSNCLYIPSSLNPPPYGIAASAGYAYYSQPAGNAIYVSQILMAPNSALNGSFGQTYKKYALISPTGLAINNGNLYVASKVIPGILSCPILAGGTLGECHTALEPTVGPYTKVNGVAFYNGFMYLAISSLDGTDGAVYACSLDKNGAADNCIYTSITNAIGVSFNNSYAFVSADGSPITRCAISSSGNGSLVHCASTAAGSSTFGSTIY